MGVSVGILEMFSLNVVGLVGACLEIFAPRLPTTDPVGFGILETVVESDPLAAGWMLVGFWSNAGWMLVGI